MSTMTLRCLLDDADAPDIAIGGVSSDSRRVRPGDLFVAYRGAAYDGHDYAAAAVAAGAAAILSERPVAAGVPGVVMDDAGLRLGELCRRFHRAPSRELDVVGITGTNGKTTVAYTLAQILDRGAYIGTLGWGRPPRLKASILTTADPASLQAQLRALCDRGSRRVALEVSSHALHQGRVDAVDFAVGAFTNLGRDHLDYHGSIERYAAAKKRLFQRPLRAAVINVDDPLGRTIAAESASRTEIIGVGRDGLVRWSRIAYRHDGVHGVWDTPWGRGAFSLPAFFGEFSVYNAACSLAVGCLLGAAFGDLVDAMRDLPGVPGRMQVVSASPTVVVDYAHTADGLRAVLAAARTHATGDGRIILVFGCGGDRDRGKRAPMAAAAESGADVVIATSDNPRSEDPQRILDDIVAGFRAPAAALRIADRRQAIAAAIDCAGASDIVVVAGKGHETHQDVGGEKRPFSDAGVVRELLGRTT